MSEAKDFNNILIVGLGLIGGSIAKKLKDISYSGKVFGLDKDIDISTENPEFCAWKWMKKE